MSRDGTTDAIMRFYRDTIRRLKPSWLYVSGGEPLLYPGIAPFLNYVCHYVDDRIHVFCSFQFDTNDFHRIPFDAMPLAKTTVNHTVSYFEPEPWSRHTRGFPFSLYLENLKSLAETGVQKRFKLIVNQERFEEKLGRFLDTLGAPSGMEIGLKVINEQGNGLNVAKIEQTRLVALKNLKGLNEKYAGVRFVEGSLARMAPMLDGLDPADCHYARQPAELRFSFYRIKNGTPVLKYRYCPYFPPSCGHRFHIGKDNPKKFVRNFFRGNFRQHCSDCRFVINYLQGNRQRPPAHDQANEKK